MKSEIIVMFNLEKKIRIETDTSDFTLGVVLS